VRRARLTYSGAFHHVVSKAYGGRRIFGDARLKTHFLNLLRDHREQFRMRVFAYCDEEFEW